MNAERLTPRSRRYLERARAEVKEAERVDGPRRRALLRGAARQFMHAGFHDFARDARRLARGGDV